MPGKPGSSPLQETHQECQLLPKEHLHRAALAQPLTAPPAPSRDRAELPALPSWLKWDRAARELCFFTPVIQERQAALHRRFIPFDAFLCGFSLVIFFFHIIIG